jgi:peroxiredoxin
VPDRPEDRPEDRPPEDRFGDLGPSEPTAAERFAELDERDMEAERQERERKAPGPPRPGGRYTWVVGIAALVVVIVVAFNSLPNAGRGYRGPEKGERIPVFAAPLATSDEDGDANIKQDAADDEAGNETPACDVDLSAVVTACDLFEEKPLVLALAVPADDCERQLEAMQALSEERPDLQFAAVISGRPHETAQEVVERTGVTFPVAVDRDLAVFNLYRVAYCSTAITERGGELREFRANKPLSADELERMLP